MERSRGSQRFCELAVSVDMLHRLRLEEQGRASLFSAAGEDDIPSPSAESTDEHQEAVSRKIIAVLSRMAKLPITGAALQRTGAGREVNHSFIRRHPNGSVRAESRKLIRQWRAMVRDNASRPARQSDCNINPPPAPAGQREATQDRSDYEDMETDNVKGREFRGLDTIAVFNRWPVQQLKAAMLSCGLNAELSRCVEKYDIAAILAASVESAFEGRWRAKDGYVEILGRTVTWQDGLQVAFEVTGINCIRLPWQDNLIQGRLENERLCWDDGDVWLRSQKKRGKAAQDRSVRTSIGKARRSFLHHRRASVHNQKRNGQRRLSATPPVAHRPDLRQELKRIAAAKTPAAVLGFDTESLSSRRKRMSFGSLSLAVRKRYRELTRLVHPDKCPPSMKSSATVAFQRLTDAKNSLLAC